MGDVELGNGLAELDPHRVLHRGLPALPAVTNRAPGVDPRGKPHEGVGIEEGRLGLLHRWGEPLITCTL